MSGLLILLHSFGLTYTRNLKFVTFFAVLAVFLAVIYVFLIRLSDSFKSIYMVIYHIVFGLTLVFIIPVDSPFVYLWALLLFFSDYYYQTKGLVLSASALFAALMTSIWYQTGGIELLSVLSVSLAIAVIVSICLIVSKLAFGNRSERKQLDTQYIQAEYEHDRLLTLINTMADAVIATDDEGVITTYNGAALDLLNTNKTLAGLSIDRVLKLIDTDGKDFNLIQLARATQYLTRRNDVSLPINDDDNVNLDISISRISSSIMKSDKQGFTFILRDITEKKSLAEERDLFISEVSHELRTPITISEGDMSMAVLLVEKEKPDIGQIKDSIIKAHEQVVYLADMVNDLSSLSRAQMENKGMEVTSFNVTEVIDELMQTYSPQAEAKGLYFKTDIIPFIPAITTSELYFKEIMQNFVTNAVKYTKKGGIVIKAQSVDKDNVIVSVIDTGAGIARSEQNKVYQKFWRSEDPYTRSTSGTGLGLYITAKLADRIGGYLMLESEIKKGSTFSIVIPVRAFKDVDQSSVTKNEVAHLFS